MDETDLNFALGRKKSSQADTFFYNETHYWKEMEKVKANAVKHS